MNALALLFLFGPGQPPKDPAPDAKAEAEESGAVAKKLAGEFVVEIEKGGKKVKLERDAEPVLRWSNHLGRRFYGDVFVWTYKGRPEAVASVNNVFGQKRVTEAELVSLSTGRPLLTHNEKLVWGPAEPGVELKPLPGAPKPAATAAARLTQMRALAAQFAVAADYGIDKEQKEDLRLMATPIFRYQSAEQDVADGGLFAFTKGTDPDALLVIEARQKKDGAEWQYAFARLNGWCVLRGTHR
ncbi:MAG: hypothetical protein J0I06_05790, partial [Planctomycetes bacterium]|nr:hypothetical protein [Planctomycetota bacterium]